MVTDPAYVNEILDRSPSTRASTDDPSRRAALPYDLEAHQIDVHSVSARKPLFMDESAHDWHLR